MPSTATVKSLNLGIPQGNPAKSVNVTGINKQPVTHAVVVRAPGPKGTGAVGLEGDRVYDTQAHGGDDQAVYAYAREDLDSWADRLGRPLTDGQFGENLTTSGIDVNGALIGERWQIGPDLILEVSCPRIPCSTFAHWLGEEGWIKCFTQAAQPGTYLRVIAPGSITAGDEISITHRPGHSVTVATCFRALTTEPALLPQLLHPEAIAALPPEDVARITRRLTSKESNPVT